MTKKKSIIGKLLIALVMLTLISFCFLGTTFARYTSQGTGSASVTVAKWSITDKWGENTDGSTTVNFASLSPSATGYNSATPADVTKSTGKKAVLTITYDLGVNATVTLNMQDYKFYGYENDGSVSTTEFAAYDTTHTANAVKGLFSLKLYQDGTEVTLSSGTATVNLTAGKGTIAIEAELIWTTKYASSTDSGVTEDELDTWVGKNIASVGFDLTYTAVQASEQPTA